MTATNNPTHQTTSHTINPPRSGTKLDKLVSMLRRKKGATLDQISERLGWQRHTSRATITGLRKRGFAVELIQEEGKISRYILQTPDTK